MSLRKSFMRRISTRTQPIVSDSNSKSCTDSAGEGDVAVAVEKLTVDEEDSWGTLCADLLGEIIGRVEAAGDRWPLRRSVVACGGVCKRWRDVTKEIVRCSEKITFPSCLKLAGPREPSQQCIIVRDKKNSTFYLYMAIPNTFTLYGKLLLAAKRCRHGAHTEYIISLDCNDISQRSNTYVGKLSSDFLGTNFTIFDSQAPHNDVRPSNHKGSRRVASKQISPQLPAGNFEVAQVSYKFNLLKSGGPRRMVCNVKTPRSDTYFNQKHEEISKGKKSESSIRSSTVLRNKAPTWHEHLQCWCLNFHGRVTVASVKNFQLVATIDQTQPGGKLQEDTIILQFGKVADDTFTMDYRDPLSAFQAFAICLTSFGTKLACE